jgi:hypothetical protein
MTFFKSGVMINIKIPGTTPIQSEHLVIDFSHALDLVVNPLRIIATLRE